jgi:DNA sulfur modification protein DndD
MIQSEFQRFLQTLLSSPSTAPVHKFANLILKHLDKIVPLGTHQGQRVKHVAKLAQKNWTNKGVVVNLSKFHKSSII